MLFVLANFSLFNSVFFGGVQYSTPLGYPRFASNSTYSRLTYFNRGRLSIEAFSNQSCNPFFYYKLLLFSQTKMDSLHRILCYRISSGFSRLCFADIWRS